MTDDIDILFIIPGRINPDAPTPGVGILKSHLKNNGFKSKVIDLNIELFHYLKDSNDSFFSANNNLVEHPKKVSDIILDENIWGSYNAKYTQRNPDLKQWMDFDQFYNNTKPVWDKVLQEIELKKPKFVGFSILSWFLNSSVSLKLSELIKENFPKVKIVFGGPGLLIQSAQDLKNKGLIDYWVNGDGEDALVELLKGNDSHPHINGFYQSYATNIYESTMPDFDDIDWSKYTDKDPHKKMAYVSSSKGCVRSCDFCNEWKHATKFRYRSAESIVQELVLLKEKYNRNHVFFSDSLINGSMKAYRELMHAFVYDERLKDISWQSQFIIRSERQMPDEDWELTGKTKVTLLEVGLESFSEKIRNHMGKKSTDDDVSNFLEKTRKYGIPISLNIMPGYPFETEEDHQKNINGIKMLYQNGHGLEYNKNGYQLINFNITTTFVLTKYEDIWDKVKDEVTEYNSMHDWVFRNNTLKVRKRRQFELQDLINENIVKYNLNPPTFIGAIARYNARKKEKELGLI